MNYRELLARVHARLRDSAPAETLRYEGLAFDPQANALVGPDGRTPLGAAANLNVDLCDMPEGGFGWFLIKDLAKDVTYHRVEPENHLSLRLAVAMA